MTQYYAGIGSRSTPPSVRYQITAIATRLGEEGWTLRSGGADGADTAFENGAGSHPKEIYLPWKNFNGSNSHLVVGDYPRMRAVAQQFHPAWDRCSQGARKLHTRNVAQVLGVDPHPMSELVICWTPEGQGGGGTGQAIRIAVAYKIPVFDLWWGNERLFKFLGW